VHKNQPVVIFMLIIEICSVDVVCLLVRIFFLWLEQASVVIVTDM
jgi:hypothetical protein